MDNKQYLKTLDTEKKSDKVLEEKKNDRKTAGKTFEKKKTAKQKAVIYMGPSVPDNILISGKIYKKPPEYVSDFISKNPVFGKLIIDVEKLAEFKRKVEGKGTEEHSLYSECLKIINEGGLL